LAADIAGYSRLIGADEGGTLQALKALRAELLDPTIASHNGRLVKTTGDGYPRDHRQDRHGLGGRSG
jgi:adenylate cyclase